MHQRIKYDVLSHKELEFMKDRLEQILIERGVHLDHEEMLKALEEKGCIVDMEARDVRFTKELIDKAIAAVPAEFTLYSPDGKQSSPPPTDVSIPAPARALPTTATSRTRPITSSPRKSASGIISPTRWRT